MSNSEATMPAVFEARRVSKSFAGVHALNDVDFAVHPGSIHALVGENGAGKSTLIKVLTGVYRPDDGSVVYQGDTVTFSQPADAQNIGISTVYQEVNLVPKLSIARNIFLGREPRTWYGLIDMPSMNARAKELLDDLGIHVDVTADLETLGLGVQQMVALGRAVTIDAKVVIMDEPTSSLEQREVETLFRIARRLRDGGCALIFVSHRLDELWQLCDRVTILRDGELVHTGEMEQLSRRNLIAHMLGRDIGEEASAADSSAGTSANANADGTRVALMARDFDVLGKLSGVRLSVRAGEVVGLGGLLGAGRSETVKAIYGALPSSRGTTEVDGVNVRRNSIRASMRAGIALLSEDRKAEGIVPGLSVRENIVLAVTKRISRGGVISRAKMDALVDEYVRRLKIKVSSPGQKVGELSGGNQQKVLIARWLATRPKVFLLDEPTRGIDVGAKFEVRGLIDELAAEGLAVVMISSETEELVDMADRVIVLRDGAVDDELSGAALTNQGLLRSLVGTEKDE